MPVKINETIKTPTKINIPNNLSGESQSTGKIPKIEPANPMDRHRFLLPRIQQNLEKTDHDLEKTQEVGQQSPEYNDLLRFPSLTIQR